MQYSRAKQVANRVVELLTPHTTTIHIAGSIRRLQPEVKDIEVLCIPKTEFIASDLFGGGSMQTITAFYHAIDAMAEKIVKGAPGGRYMQIILKGGYKLDLFKPSPDDYYRQYAIRTGSADYSHNILAAAWVAKGWCGTSDGLRKQSDCFKDNSDVWRISNKEGEKPPVWNSEEDFFNWLGVDCVDPALRSYLKKTNSRFYEKIK